ncbi:hypothetical protein VP01_956g8 [Puccinia sorghi]|uniref:GATA-type domain-containing protein n=1 Tax=Puccinia sorghi TaxID=27349 RepID=A0A0L6U8D4_9BASI|nr:hypothetical protein VP01_956g8 [Puccinia sorghi]
MASAANVLGSFHRAHYHHPQSILALQDAHHHHHHISPPSSAHATMLGYDSYGLQNLASMAANVPFDPPLPPPDLHSSGSSGSSGSLAPHPTAPDSYSLTAPAGASLPPTVHHIFQTAAPKDPTRLSPVTNQPPDSDNNLLSMVQTSGHGHHPPPSSSSSSSDVLSVGAPYRALAGDSTRPFFHDSRLLKRPRPSSMEHQHTLAPPTGTGEPVRCCTSCGALNSPEWRKGPNGVKSLCNACGLRFSRAQARKSKPPKNNLSAGNNNFKKAQQLQQQQQQQQQTTGTGKKKQTSPDDGRPVVDGFRG